MDGEFVNEHISWYPVRIRHKILEIILRRSYTKVQLRSSMSEGLGVESVRNILCHSPAIIKRGGLLFQVHFCFCKQF